MPDLTNSPKAVLLVNDKTSVDAQSDQRGSSSANGKTGSGSKSTSKGTTIYGIVSEKDIWNDITSANEVLRRRKIADAALAKEKLFTDTKKGNEALRLEVQKLQDSKEKLEEELRAKIRELQSMIEVKGTTISTLEGTITTLQTSEKDLKALVTQYKNRELPNDLDPALDGVPVCIVASDSILPKHALDFGPSDNQSGYVLCWTYETYNVNQHFILKRTKPNAPGQQRWMITSAYSNTCLTCPDPYANKDYSTMPVRMLGQFDPLAYRSERQEWWITKKDLGWVLESVFKKGIYLSKNGASQEQNIAVRVTPDTTWARWYIVPKV